MGEQRAIVDRQSHKIDNTEEKFVRNPTFSPQRSANENIGTSLNSFVARPSGRAPRTAFRIRWIDAGLLRKCSVGKYLVESGAVHPQLARAGIARSDFWQVDNASTMPKFVMTSALLLATQALCKCQFSREHTRVFTDYFLAVSAAYLWRHSPFGGFAMFKTNVGSMDRMLRIILGVGLLSLVFVGPQTPLGWIGLVPLLTGLMSTCPIYSMFGWSSRDK